MRRSIAAFLGLEIYAGVFALFQLLGGVRTDEAKYLLNIPYPHPPLMRWILSQVEGWQSQEFFVRFIIASVVVQAVWLVWRQSRWWRHEERLALAGCWLLSGGVLLQSGSIMMAPLIALQALVFVWVAAQRDEDWSPWSHFLGLLWLASLFTAYQAVLVIPLVIAIFWRMHISTTWKLLYILLPLFLLVLYTLSNPLAAASFVHVSADNSSLASREWVEGALRSWLVGGSVVLSVVGVWGMILTRSWSLFLSFLLVFGYAFISSRSYHAILFTPLLIGGLIELHQRRRVKVFPIFLFTGASAIVLSLNLSVSPPSPAREVSRVLAERGVEGELLIAGPFGHEWQYESLLPVRRYKPEFLPGAGAVVCIHPSTSSGQVPCKEIESEKGWMKVQEIPIVLWVRSR